MDTSCTYRGNREEILIAYLYDAVDPVERASFDAHLASCHACREELDELGVVRTRLGEWAPPVPAAGWRADRASAGSIVARRSLGSALGEMPAWAQVAAALLVVGVSAGAANLHITYGGEGLSVRTGWMASPPASSEPVVGRAPASAISASSTSDAAPWRVELAALEQQLRNELTSANTRPPANARDTASDAAVLRRVRELIEDSEKRQRVELAFRVAELSGAMRSQQGNIDRNLSVIQTRTSNDMIKLYQIQQDLASRVALVR